MQENMKNVAYTKEYLDMLDDIYCRLFIPKCYKNEVSKELEKNLRVLTKGYFYDNGDSKHPYKLQGSETVIFRDETEIYSYKTVDDADRDCWMFSHQNGHDYFLFARGLYGYSVLDLVTMQDYHFYPAESFPTGETFIWCDVHYNPINNIMAVVGCYWACPYSVVLVDFSKPMEDTRQIDINNFINKGDHYDDMDFVAWDGTDLILKINGQTKPVQQEVRRVSSDEYMKWFAERIDTGDEAK